MTTLNDYAGLPRDDVVTNPATDLDDFPRAKAFRGIRMARGSRVPVMLLACGVLLAALLLPPRADGQVDPPNVLLIVTDDQRATNTLWTMPKTRAAFAGGTRYTNAFAVTPLCCP